MAAHRYWRLHVSAQNGNNDIVIGELILAITVGGASVATGGTPTASDTVGGSSVANAFDGTTSSANAWASATTHAAGNPAGWIQYDFGGTPRDIVEMRIYFPAAGTFTVGSAPNTFILYWSDDALTWTRARAYCSQVFSSGVTKALDVTPLSGGSIYNRMLPGVGKYRNTVAALTQAMYPTLLRGPSITRADNWTRPRAWWSYSGHYHISGSTTVLGNPAARRVDLYDQASGILLRRIDTKSDGAFTFSQIALKTYMLVGTDVTATQNSVVYAHVTSVP